MQNIDLAHSPEFAERQIYGQLAVSQTSALRELDEFAQQVGRWDVGRWDAMCRIKSLCL